MLYFMLVLHVWYTEDLLHKSASEKIDGYIRDVSLSTAASLQLDDTTEKRFSLNMCFNLVIQMVHIRLMVNRRQTVHIRLIHIT